ncbi:MAG: hypothetical protein ABJN24_07310 [Hyphomicrobiales bacterium]
MVAEAIAGLGALKTALDLTKGLKDINDAALRNSAVIELQEHILSAQQEQFALSEHVRQLEKQIAEFEAWEHEKTRYELKELEPGNFAYALKEGMGEVEPAHYLCASCYSNGRKEILQGNTSCYGLRIIRCGNCKAEIKHSKGPPAQSFNSQVIY